ncbi:GIY-YIG nuclease family protein [Klebsiella aerogenes]
MTDVKPEFQVLTEMKVPDEHRENGFIYVLKNESMPGIYKIGMTTTSPEQRAKEISSTTGVPTPFSVVAAFHSKNPAKDEKMVHEAWKKNRVSSGREFFKLTESELSDTIDELNSIVGPERNADVADLAVYDSFICFCREREIDLADELCELGLGGINGHIPAVKNFLLRAGISYAKEIISKYNSSIVINPDSSVVLVKSVDAQYIEAWGEK